MSSCYSIRIADAKIKTPREGYFSLSKVRINKYRFLNIAKLLDEGELDVWQFDEDTSPGHLSGGVPRQAQPYAALSYVWKNLTFNGNKDVPNSETDDPKGSFMHADLPNEYPTSVSVLTTVCKAARQQGCKYLWMDKLCIRQDGENEKSENSKDGKADKAWQMARMYNVYENCEVCLVAAGGMIRLPRLVERTAWIDRAWTLQEALAPPKVLCLFVWNSGDKVISGGNIAFTVDPVEEGVGMADLSYLLAANLHADVPEMIDSKDYKGRSIKVAVLPPKRESIPDPQIWDSSVWCFGNRNADDWPIKALQGALSRQPKLGALEPVDDSELAARRLGIWRCITTRNAAEKEDFIYATMGLFGASVEPSLDPQTNAVRGKGYPREEVLKLLYRFIEALSNKGSRADWFAIAPELGPPQDTTALPLMLDIDYSSKSSELPPSLKAKERFKYWDAFGWYLGDAVKYTVEAPSSIKVTAPTHPIILTTASQEDKSRKFLTRIHDKHTFEVADGNSEGLFAVVIGKKARYNIGYDPSFGGDDPDVIFLMLVERIPSAEDKFRNTGYAWVNTGFTDGWSDKTLRIE